MRPQGIKCFRRLQIIIVGTATRDVARAVAGGKGGTFHAYTLRRSVTVRASKGEAWGAVSKIMALPRWVEGVKECRPGPGGRRRGVGAVRDVVFGDGTVIEEHVVAWRDGESFSYVAVSGLPLLRAYVATISVGDAGASGGSARITWQSHMSSKRMTSGEFGRFVESMQGLYSASLGNLRSLIESGGRI